MYKDCYIYFIKNLLVFLLVLDDFSIWYFFFILMFYKCLIEGFCKGGLDFLCDKRYKGLFCGVCSIGYYK